MRKKNLWKKAASVIIAAAMMMSTMPVYAGTSDVPVEDGIVVEETTGEENNETSTTLATESSEEESTNTENANTEIISTEADFEAAINGNCAVIELKGNIALSRQITINRPVTIKGNGHTISVASDQSAWPTDNSGKYMLLITGSGVSIDSIVLNGKQDTTNENVCGGIQFYKATGGKISDITLNNFAQLGLNINASQVTATGTLSQDNIGWKGINVSYGQNIQNKINCEFDCSGATISGVDLIYTDNSDKDNAGDKSIIITTPSSGWGRITNLEMYSCYAPSKAQIDGVQYGNLQSAINEASNDQTITMTASVNENITVESGKSIVLDLNGFTLNGGIVKEKPAILNNGTLVIKDSSDGKGLIKREENNVTKGYYVIDNQGNMTIEGGRVYNNTGIKNEIGGASLIRNAGVDKPATLNIKGGHLQQDNFIVVKNDDYGILNVTGGEIISSNESAIQNWSQATISGGNINGIIWTSVWKDEFDNSKTTITGDVQVSGGFIVKRESNDLTKHPEVEIQSGYYDVDWYYIEDKDLIKITGGTFSSNPTTYVVKGYHAHSNTAGNKWGVSETDGHNYNYKNNGYNYYCICGDSVYIPPYTPPQPTTPPATTDTVTNPDGSTTSTTTQENTDGSTTTTVVDKDSNGNVTGTTETTEKTTGNTTTKTETATTVDGAQTVTETTTVKNQDGSTEETKKVTDKDANGNVTGTTETVEKTEGNTTTTKETTTAADGSQTVTESTLVKNEDGSSEEKATITAADGSVTNVTTTTQTDGSATEVKETSEKNDAGNTVDVTATTKTDSNGDVTSVKEQSVITNVADNTSATVNVLKDGEDNVKYSRATVNKTVDEDTTRVKLEGPVVDQIESASGTSNVTITMNVNTDDGDTKYSLKVATKNLQAGNKLYVYKENPETGERTMVNSLLYTVTEDGSVTFNTKQNANFVLVNKASAAALNKAIKKTLTAAKPSSSVKAGKKIKMALNPNLNMENVKSVKYSTTQSSVAKVSSNGTITAKKAGTVSIKATITLKNGYIKTVTTKITVKE